MWPISRLKPRAERATSLLEALRRLERNACRAEIALRIAYYFPLYWMATHALKWQELATVEHGDWLWPSAWLVNVEPRTAVPLALVACIIVAFVSAVFSARRWARVMAALALLEFLALKFSLGKIHHLMHGWLLLLCVLCFAPNRGPSLRPRARRYALLSTYVAGQLVVAVTYTLSGLGKVLGLGYQLLQGEAGLLSPQSLPLHVAARLLETHDTSLLGRGLVELGAWTWPPFIITVYFQVFAVACVLRPRLHWLLGLVLVSFHLMSALALMIDFTPAIVLCGLLYCSSAWASSVPSASSARDVFWELPLLGGLFGLVPKARSVTSQLD
jgi:hypothetical protein